MARITETDWQNRKQQPPDVGLLNVCVSERESCVLVPFGTETSEAVCII